MLSDGLRVDPVLWCYRLRHRVRRFGFSAEIEDISLQIEGQSPVSPRAKAKICRDRGTLVTVPLFGDGSEVLLDELLEGAGGFVVLGEEIFIFLVKTLQVSRQIEFHLAHIFNGLF
jgi:hypothetical protein